MVQKGNRASRFEQPIEAIASGWINDGGFGRAVAERRVSDLFTDAVAEVPEEHRDLPLDAVRESLEEVAMIRTIQHGKESPASASGSSSTGSNARREHPVSEPG